jgi:subtilisin family serine protease
VSSTSDYAAVPVPTSEVVVTLEAPALTAFGRTLTSASHESYAAELAAAQAQAQANITAAIPTARVRWRYRLVADGFALVLPTAEVKLLPHIRGIAEVWPTISYHSLRTVAVAAPRSARVAQGPEVVQAESLWGASLQTAGNGIKIGIIDDGLEASHPYFNPSGMTYPPGFPKGLTASTTPKVIVARTFPPASPAYRYAAAPFDPSVNGSFHATHVAGIAAGDYDTADGATLLSGIAPKAYLGNYKALTIPTPGFGLDGNSPEITAAIEAAVGDGMNVLNLSLGEPEVDPARDIVVQAIDAAARAGVVSVVAADNQFEQYAYGSISSPGNAPDAITVAATTDSDVIADFSSGGPTPVSLLLKPDVSAPGVAITSSLPVNQGGPYGELSGTSMATPQVSGGVALLMERHPDWTVEEIKSALVQTGLPVHGSGGKEVSVLREGGGLIDLLRADTPLLFANPTSITFPADGGTEPVALTNAGGGAGRWSVSVELQDPRPGVAVEVDPSVSVPGKLTVTASVSASAGSGDVTGFVVLTRDGQYRRIPFWVEVDHPVLGSEPAVTLTRPGTYTANTRDGESKVSHYRYPTAGDGSYPGPEIVYRVHLTQAVANFGVAVLSGTAVPHIVFAGDEDHLVGFSALPGDINPYLSSFGESRPVAAAVLPGPGNYEIVFDTRSAADAGVFTFRYWVNDTTPPVIHIVSTSAQTITVSISDSGSGVDPESIEVTLDGNAVRSHFSDGRLVVAATPGSHRLVVTASGYQELKNMEDVGPILPNTATLSRTVNVG